METETDFCSHGIPPRSLWTLEKEYLLQNYTRYPLVIHRGRGCLLFDVHGKRYLDSDLRNRG
jgi:acetylornithine/succinyldiaminopimelate/putrescine aminotransferase